jgi:hypothetical protein
LRKLLKKPAALNDGRSRKTRRFGDLVRQSGRPESVTLWLGPKGDKTFLKAVGENRVLTVHKEPGKTDRGRIGFHQAPGAIYLVFPRTLPKDTESRIVGINLQLLADEDDESVTGKARGKGVKASGSLSDQL